MIKLSLAMWISFIIIIIIGVRIALADDDVYINCKGKIYEVAKRADNYYTCPGAAYGVQVPTAVPHIAQRPAPTAVPQKPTTITITNNVIVSTVPVTRQETKPNCTPAGTSCGAGLTRTPRILPPNAGDGGLKWNTPMTP